MCGPTAYRSAGQSGPARAPRPEVCSALRRASAGRSRPARAPAADDAIAGYGNIRGEPDGIFVYGGARCDPAQRTPRMYPGFTLLSRIRNKKITRTAGGRKGRPAAYSSGLFLRCSTPWGPLERVLVLGPRAAYGFVHRSGDYHGFQAGPATEPSEDFCAAKQTKRSRRVAPGRICNVTALLLCPPEPLLSASMRTAVTPGGTSYSWTTSHGIAAIGPLLR